MNDWRGQALPALFEYEAADGAIVGLGPNDEYIGDRSVGDPHFRAGQQETAVSLARARDHRPWVGSVVGFGQAETADPLAGGELGKVLALLRLATELVDGNHHER
jgi:hypothetical protein